MRLSRWTYIALLMAALGAAAWRPLHAQDGVIPAEATALFDSIADIDKLRVVNPLKLTPDEVDRIVAAVQKSQADYNRALSDAAVPAIKEIAPEIRSTREKMLTGAPIPTDFDEKVKKLQDAFLKKRDTADYDTLKGLSATIRSILTSDQISKVISLSRKALEEDGKPTAKGSDDKFFNFYVMSIFIKYPRIIPLLQDIKKAALPGDKPGSSP